ncbi:Acetohydroxy-acid synthase small subunit [Durusdinium trenchii]
MIPLSLDSTIRQTKYLRLDCFVVDSFLDIRNYLASSEVLFDPLRCPDLILYARDKDELLRQLHSCQVPQLESVSKLVVTFLTSFENAASKMLTGDEYQVFFHLFILYDCLVKLHYIRDGGRRFLHLPKHVFRVVSDEVCHKLRAQLPDVPTERSKWSFDGTSPWNCPFLLSAYLHQFRTCIAAETDPELASMFQATMDPLQVPRSVETMRLILERAGATQIHHQIFCCVSEGGILDAHPAHEIKSVLELYGDGLEQAKTTHEKQCLKVPLPLEPGENAVGEKSSARFGQVLRALLVAKFPVLLRCRDGRRTAAVATLLRFITDEVEVSSIMLQKWLQAWDMLDALGMLHLLPCDDQLRTRANAEKVHAKWLQEKIGMGCGLSWEELQQLRIKLRGTPTKPVPVHFSLIKGEPDQTCRAFTQSELVILEQHFLSPKLWPNLRPKGVFVTGLPGAGKSSLLQEVLSHLDIELQDVVNLDVDEIRRFHGQYQEEAQKLSWSELAEPADAINFQSYQGLAGWFHAGVDAEQILYQGPNSVVSQLMGKRCHFVLPGIFDEPGTLEFMRFVASAGYEVHLVGIHVSPETAQERVETRADRSGRASRDTCAAALLQQFMKLADFVKQKGGVVALYDNEASNADSCPLHPLYWNGVLRDAETCRWWGLA